MRRIPRRIGLFGGPGAIVRAAGAGKRRLTDEAAPDPKPEPLAGADGASPSATPKKSWLRWFGGRKSKP